MIVKENDQKKGIYFIKKGKIKCFKTSEDDKEIIVKFLCGGDLMGYSILFDKSQHEISAICVEDSTICFLPMPMAIMELKTNLEFLTQIARRQNEDLQFLAQIILNNAIKSVRERIANSIYLLFNQFGLDQSGFIDISLTREEMANMSSTTTESAIRYLSEFQKDRIIEIYNRKIKIVDMTKFKKLLGQMDQRQPIEKYR